MRIIRHWWSAVRRIRWRSLIGILWPLIWWIWITSRRWLGCNRFRVARYWGIRCRRSRFSSRCSWFIKLTKKFNYWINFLTSCYWTYIFCFKAWRGTRWARAGSGWWSFTWRFWVTSSRLIRSITIQSDAVSVTGFQRNMITVWARWWRFLKSNNYFF